MDGRDLKNQWRSGSPSFGAWIMLADPAVAGFMANVGFDWVFIDAEHSPFNPETLRNILVFLRDRDTVSIVRVRENDPAIIKQALDWGAEGIMFPFIRSAEDARRAVAACRYPPAGMRGFNPREPSNFYADLDEYLATADERIITVLQVEHVDAVNNMDEILQVSGVDAVMIGPADLSYSLGVPLQFRHPKMQEAIDATIRKAKAAGVPIGMTWEDTTEGYLEYLSRGLAFISPYADTDFLTMAASGWLQEMRAASERL